jgi:hypothetical protein
MKKVHYAALAVALAAVPAVAQAQQAQEQHREHAEAWMQQRGPGMSASALAGLRAELNLSDAQVAELEGIAARLQAQNEPLLAQLREHAQERVGEVRQRREAMTAEQREQMQQRREAMTAEQREQMREQMQQRREAMTAEQREQMREQMQQRREAMTAEQREQMRERMQQRREAMTAEQREQMRERMGRAGTAAGTGTAVGRRVPEELRPVMQQLRENHQSALQQAAAVLTPEQQAQARALMAERREGWRERASERREQRLERRERRDQGERPAAGPRGPRARALNR